MNDPLQNGNALGRLKAHLAENQYPLNSRMPSERALSRELGVNRTALRKALDELEADGQIWRHVGRGTFIGSRPVENTNDVSFIASRTNPADVMQTRLIIEPELARLAALHTTSADIRKMEQCIRKTKAAREWRLYEAWDNNFHRSIAAAARNRLLLTLFDTLNTVRRAVVWGRRRTTSLGPSLEHHSFSEHDALLAAITDRDADLAAQRMRQHLGTVGNNLLELHGVGGLNEDRKGRR
jgi:DNA-binding FadR family transcriptional regulator